MSGDQWPRVKELFHAALQHPAEARSTFLTDACGGDESLRHAVERLLTAHEAAGSFIEASPVAGIVHTIPPLESSLIGHLVGHYAIERLVGVGGMGEVYAAHDTELGRTVALKVVTGDSEDAQARLRREAQHASRLNHPHICTIHHVGTFEHRAFIVMEFVEGRTLKEVIGDEGLPIDETLRYATQITDALAHAHAQRVIHRDLKSANVVVTPDGRAKVLDFGLARDASSTSDARLAGTLSCMAPELLRGGAADERSDIWALGVLLYEMAAGRAPFGKGNAFEQSAAILASPPAPLPERLPAALKTVIGRCLAKDPSERYARASEVRSALEAVHGQPSTGERWFRSRAAILTFAGLVCVAAASPFVARWVLSTPAATAVPTSDAPAIAVAYFENIAGAPDTAWLSKGVASMLLTTLAQTRGLRIISTQHLHQTVRGMGSDSLDSLKPEQMADVAKRAGAGAVVVGSIMKAGSEIRIDARLEDLSTGRVLLAESVRGTDVFPLVDQLAERIRDRIGFRNATDIRSVADVSSMSLEAYRLYSEGEQAYLNFRLDDAKDALDRAVAIDPAFAQAYLRLASLSEFQNLPAARADYLRDAAAHADRLSERERMVVDVEQARESGDFSKAASTLDRLIATYPDFENAYPLATLYEPLRGSLYDPAKGVALYEIGIRAIPRSGALRNYYAYGLLSMGRYAEALQQFEAYVRLSPREPNPYDSLAEFYLMTGVPLKAIEYYSQAMTVDPTFTDSRDARAWARATLGQYDEAGAERGPGVAVNAFLMSRVGRYRDAAQIISTGVREAEGNKNLVQKGEVLLVSSLLAIDRREYARALQDARAAAEYFTIPDERTRLNRLLVDLLSGIAESRAGRPSRAQSHLESVRLHYRPEVAAEKWWRAALESEIAIAEGRWQDAAVAYTAGEPTARLYTSIARAPSAFVLAYNLPSRDSRARTLSARGDLNGAIQEYRRLNAHDSGQQWIAVFEPKYVLEIARLLRKAGDAEAARREYLHFLDLWKRADPGLPELAEARHAVARPVPDRPLPN